MNNIFLTDEQIDQINKMKKEYEMKIRNKTHQTISLVNYELSYKKIKLKDEENEIIITKDDLDKINTNTFYELNQNSNLSFTTEGNTIIISDNYNEIRISKNELNDIRSEYYEEEYHLFKQKLIYEIELEEELDTEIDDFVVDIIVPQKETKLTKDLVDDTTELYIYPDKIKIPDQIEIIKEYAFENNKDMKEIEFSKNLKKIEHAAFKNCGNLNTIIIPNGLDITKIEVEYNAFENCHNEIMNIIDNNEIKKIEINNKEIENNIEL